jgi:hypothetical protein
MKSLHYSIRYENQTVDEDTLNFYYGEKPTRKKLAVELAASFLASEVFDLENDQLEKLGEPIPCQISRGLWEVQFHTPFCPEPESVVVRFHS